MMQTDVLSAYITASGVVVNSAARVKAVYINANTAAAGNVTLLDGGATGTKRVVLDVPSSATNNPVYVLLPGEGVRFTSNVYANLASMTSVTVVYG